MDQCKIFAQGLPVACTVGASGRLFEHPTAEVKRHIRTGKRPVDAVHVTWLDPAAGDVVQYDTKHTSRAGGRSPSRQKHTLAQEHALTPRRPASGGGTARRCRGSRVPQIQHNALPFSCPSGTRHCGFRRRAFDGEVAHEMLMGGANGVGQQKHTHFCQKGQGHTRHRAVEGQPVHAFLHGAAKQRLVVGHMASFSRCFASASPPSSVTLRPSRPSGPIAWATTLRF